MAKDDLTDALRNIASELPEPRRDLSEVEKEQLIVKVGGPRTANSIVKAKKSYPLARIPFLFSSLDTQAVIDILANEMDEALERSFDALPPKPGNRKK